MKLIERVYYSLIGKKIKSLLLLLVITILGAFLSASFSIYQANKSLEKTVYENLNPVILIDWNNPDMIIEETLFENESYQYEIIDKLKNDERVKFLENRYILESSLFNVHYNFALKNQNFEIIKLSDDYNTICGAVGENGDQQVCWDGALFFHGVDSYILSDLESESYILSSGRSFTKEEIDNGENVFLFTYRDDMVEYNVQKVINSEKYYLTIDKILFVSYNNSYSMNIENIDYQKEFDMVGSAYKFNSTIFDKNHSISTLGKLFIPLETMKKLNDDIFKILDEYESKYNEYKDDYFIKNKRLYYMVDTYLELKNASGLKMFIDELESKIGDLGNVYSYSDSYNDVKGITRNLNFIAIISLVICSIASIILLSLIIQVIVNERKYEIGVYLSMGEKRINVIKQIVLEVLIIGLLGMTLSLFAGNMIASSLSSDLLERQIAQIEIDKNEFDKENSFEIDGEEIISAYEVAINSEYIISVYAGGILVLLISCIVPMNGIMKMKVKKMLL